MKFSPLVVLSMFSLVAAQAESPDLEESSFSPVSTLHFDLASNENESLDEELFLLDAESDDLEEDLNLLDASIAESEEKALGNLFETKDPEIQSPVIDIAMPFDNNEQNISLDIIEDKATTTIAKIPNLLRSFQHRTTRSFYANPRKYLLWNRRRLRSSP